MAVSLEQESPASAANVGGHPGDIALFVVAIVLLAATVQFFVARFLRSHGRPADQAENLATVAAATVVAVLVPITAYIARS